MFRQSQLHITLVLFLLLGGSQSDRASAQERATAEAKPPSESFMTAEYSVAKQPGIGVKVDGRITRSSVQISNNTIPTWKVEVTIANYTNRTIRLGESMTILEKVPAIDEMVGIYIARESKQTTGHLKLMSLRYGLLWGVTVTPEGPGIWPLTALPGGSTMSMTDVFMLVLSAPWVKPFYPDGGYPVVGAGRQVVLHEEILVPLKSGPQLTFLLPPFVREEGKPPVQTMLRFNSEGQSVTGQSLVPADSIRYPFDNAATIQLPSDTTKPMWLRLHALNWLAESNFDKAAEMLLRFASDQSAPRTIRVAALLNLGLHQHKPAIPVILTGLNNKTEPVERAVAIAALGEMGDSSIASQVRPFLSDSNEMLAHEAIEAVGKLKDAESVAVLLVALGDRRKEKQSDAIAKSLAQIGSPEAWSGLLTFAGNRKSGFQPRRASVLALGSAQHRPAIPVLAGILADESDEKGIRLNAISALESVGGAEAWTAIRSTCGARDKSVAESALQAMARSKDAANKSYVIEIVGKAGHPLREYAISQINLQKIKGAGATLKATIHDPATPANLLPEALSALNTIGEKVEPDDLVPLWSAYQKETDASIGGRLADALITGRFNDKTALPFLVAGLDEGKNKLWFANIKLLRHLTGEKFGPQYQFSGDKQSRKADFDKWREWWAQQPK